MIARNPKNHNDIWLVNKNTSKTILKNFNTAVKLND